MAISKETLEKDSDYVPLSIKVIVIWFYILSVSSFLNSISFESGGFIVNAFNLVYACLALMTAYGLGAKRNTSRVIAIALAGLWFLPYFYWGWLVLYNNWSFGVYMMGKFDQRESTKMLMVTYIILCAIMQASTIAILLRPQVVSLFRKTVHTQANQ